MVLNIVVSLFSHRVQVYAGHNKIRDLRIVDGQFLSALFNLRHAIVQGHSVQFSF